MTPIAGFGSKRDEAPSQLRATHELQRTLPSERTQRGLHPWSLVASLALQLVAATACAGGSEGAPGNATSDTTGATASGAGSTATAGSTASVGGTPTTSGSSTTTSISTSGTMGGSTSFSTSGTLG